MTIGPIGDGKITYTIPDYDNAFYYHINHSAIDHSGIHSSSTEGAYLVSLRSCRTLLSFSTWVGATEVRGNLGEKIKVPNSLGAYNFNTLSETYCSLTDFSIIVDEGDPSMIEIDKSSGEVSVQVQNYDFKY